mgnify:CR=1 FL=1
MRLPYFTELGWTVITIATAFMGMIMLWALE